MSNFLWSHGRMDNLNFLNRNYGYLYNYYAFEAANGDYGAMPNGLTNTSSFDFRAPTEQDVLNLVNYLESTYGTGNAGRSLKSTYDWNDNGNGTNDVGFNALPSVKRNNNGRFDTLGDNFCMWTQSKDTNGNYKVFILTKESDDYIIVPFSDKHYGMSIRYVRDLSSDESNYAPQGGDLGDSIDYDGNRYKIIKIGDRGWMSSNLKTTQYNSGYYPFLSHSTSISVWEEDKGSFSNYKNWPLLYNNSEFFFRKITNPNTGKTWMDRNLGASRVAHSSTDSAAYGDLFQWGRGDDGHQNRNSNTTSSLSTTDSPDHGDFITSSSLPYDWRSGQNDNLWQNRLNVPILPGWRLPTQSEWEEEMLTWDSNDATGAFNSPLKLPLGGYRFYDGSLGSIGTKGFYWSSTINGDESMCLDFSSTGSGVYGRKRGFGYTVRLISE